MRYSLLLLLLFCIGCADDDSRYTTIDDTNAPMHIEIPSNFPSLKYLFKNNPPTTKGFELGKKLFYDGRLASDGLVACAFCHEQAHAFTHHGHDLSHGVNDLIGTRNTPALQNLAFSPEYFYDGASNNLEMASIVPIHNPVEMNENLPSILAKLQQDPSYQKLFAVAFDDQQISSANMLKALAQYMAFLISADAKYDHWKRQENNISLTEEEEKGYVVFSQKCASCHATDLFTDHTFRNNGLPMNPRLNDLGREEVSGDAKDRRKFKVPSLRNVALTAPYMHDGRFGSLESVLNFYTEGVEDSETLDPLLKQNNQLGIALSAQEKKQLIAFMKTLTDEKFITNKKFR